MSKELLLTADALAREKGIPYARVLVVLEQAFVKTIRRKLFGDEKPVTGVGGELIFPDSVRNQVEVTINQQTGAATNRVTYVDGRAESFNLVLDRTTASSLKQRLMELLMIAHKEILVERMFEQGGRLFRATLRSVRKGDLMIELQGAAAGLEASVPRDERVPGTDYRIGDSLEVYWMNQEDWASFLDGDERSERFDRRIVFSLKSKEWLREWLAREVVEIEEGKVVIKGIARRAGLRSKVALENADPNSKENPVDIVRGFRGGRWKRLGEMLAPEQVDFLEWNDDPVEMVVGGMGNAGIQKVSINEDMHLIELAVEKDSMPLVIGRGGANLALLSDLVGWRIKAFDLDAWEERQSAEAAWVKHLFTEGFGVEEETAQMLLDEGFLSVEELAYVSLEEALATGLGDEPWWTNIKKQAKKWLDDPKNQDYWSNWAMLHLPIVDMIELKNAGVEGVQQLADYAVDELQEIMPEEFDASRAQKAIMAARNFLYFEEEAVEAEAT